MTSIGGQTRLEAYRTVGDTTIEKRDTQRSFVGVERDDEKVWRHHTTQSRIFQGSQGERHSIWDWLGRGPHFQK